MKMTLAPSKLVGVVLGEASLNLIRPDQVPIRAKFALVNKEDDACGYVEVANGWSPKALEALKQFVEVLEEEVLARLFDVTDTPDKEQPTDDDKPPQF